MTRKRRLALGAGVGVAVAALGLAHLPAVRGAVLGQSCPFARTPTAKELETARLKSIASLRGARTSQAPARPAFGFRLDESSKDEVRAWGKSAGATCSDDVGGAAIRCEDAKADGLPIKDAFFRFDPAGHLVGLDVMREAASPHDALALEKKLATELGRSLGEPATARDATEGDLETPLARASAEYRFADYAADLSATRMGGGVVVREQYRSLR